MTQSAGSTPPTLALSWAALAVVRAAEAWEQARLRAEAVAGPERAAEMAEQALSEARASWQPSTTAVAVLEYLTREAAING